MAFFLYIKAVSLYLILKSKLMSENLILILAILISGSIGAYIGITIIKLKNKGIT